MPLYRKATWPPLTAAASASLTLGTTDADVVGATVTLDRAGTWVIRGVFDFRLIGAGDAGSLLVGVCSIDGVTQTEGATLQATTVETRASVTQTWTITITSNSIVAKLRARKSAGTGTSVASITNTTITAQRVSP